MSKKFSIMMLLLAIDGKWLFEGTGYLAIDGDFNVDCIGYAMDNKEALAKPSDFLQEVKGAINAMYGLWCKYSNYKL